MRLAVFALAGGYCLAVNTLALRLLASALGMRYLFFTVIAFDMIKPLDFLLTSPRIGRHELLKIAPDIDVVHVPHISGGSARTKLIAGRIHRLFDVHHLAKSLVDDRKLTVIARTSEPQPSTSAAIRPSLTRSRTSTALASLGWSCAPGHHARLSRKYAPMKRAK